MNFQLLKISLFVAGAFFLHQYPAAAENVPPPPPLPTGDTTAEKKSTPVKSTAPIKKGSDVVTPAPRPPGKKKSGKLRPEVTIVPRKSETRAEYRVNGILYMIKITPKTRKSRAYYLVDQHGDGVFVRSDFKPKNTIPKWALKRAN